MQHLLQPHLMLEIFRWILISFVNAFIPGSHYFEFELPNYPLLSSPLKAGSVGLIAPFETVIFH